MGGDYIKDIAEKENLNKEKNQQKFVSKVDDFDTEDDLAKNLIEELENMSPEEREEFNKMREKYQ